MLRHELIKLGKSRDTTELEREGIAMESVKTQLLSCAISLSLGHSATSTKYIHSTLNLCPVYFYWFPIFRAELQESNLYFFSPAQGKC